MANKSLPLLNQMHLFNGLVVPDFIQQETFDKIKDLPLRSDDVWIVTYPKAGTTWTQQIVRLLRSTSKADKEKKIDDAVPWIEALPDNFGVNYEEVKTDPRPRAFKSHMPYEMMPCGAPHTTPCKYIYIARNPKDVAVSLYFHTRALYKNDLSWDEFWEHYTHGNIEFGDYFNHVLGWWAHKDDDNVLFLKFEDMKKDHFTAVASIASFIGCNVSREVIDEVVSKTTFKAMKEDSTANKTWSESRDPNEKPFMRKGEVGDWMNYLTPEQSAQIDKMCERCSKVDLIFDFL